MKPIRAAARNRQTAPAFFSPDVAKARRFYLVPRPSGNSRLAVVCGGRENCASDYIVRRDTFPYYSFEYVVRGHGEVTLKGRSFTLRPGRLFSYGPGVSHSITTDAANPLVKYFVDFTGRRAPEFMRSCHLSPGRVVDVFPPTALQPLFDELIENGRLVRPATSALCTKLLECVALRIDGARAPVEGVETRAFATYEQCRRHIEQHCLRLRTLGQISGECHINNAYLCHLFRRYDSRSPYQHLLRMKMDFAVGRLRQADVLVKQVAEETGFTDPFHFSRVFRSVMGLSPAAFRKMR